MSELEIGSRWRRKANGKVATLLAVHEREKRAVLRFDDSRVLYGVTIINGRPGCYELVTEEKHGR